MGDFTWFRTFLVFGTFLPVFGRIVDSQFLFFGGCACLIAAATVFLVRLLHAGLLDIRDLRKNKERNRGQRRDQRK